MLLGLSHMFLLEIVTANHRMPFLTPVFCPTSAPHLMNSPYHESNISYFHQVCVINLVLLQKWMLSAFGFLKSEAPGQFELNCSLIGLSPFLIVPSKLIQFFYYFCS
jgi:hypothetical protein